MSRSLAGAVFIVGLPMARRRALMLCRATVQPSRHGSRHFLLP
ncbi:hypothetical protein [Roseomonas harenae]|nr:hypothetical protein [Roseomonas harenae]